MHAKLASTLIVLAALSAFGCTRQSSRPEASVPDAAVDAAPVADAEPDAVLARDTSADVAPPTLEDRFAGACMRWRTWSTPETDECEMCRAFSCIDWVLRAERNNEMCPGEYECVQETCYPTGLASSIECDCVLTCMTTEICRETWLGAMECVARNCSEECGEIPPD